MTASFLPPLSDARRVLDDVRARGYAVLPAAEVLALAQVEAAGLRALERSWDALPTDDYLRDGGRYRCRRHSWFVVHGDQVQQASHRAHWQSLDYNALHEIGRASSRERGQECDD